MKHPLEVISGVDPRIARVMEALGIRQVSDLRGRDPEELYRLECAYKGGPLHPVRLADSGVLRVTRGPGSGKTKLVVLEGQGLSAPERRSESR